MKKTVCLNMVVQNDCAVIQRCLDSIKKRIDYWVIVDTGSTDGTQELIRQTLQNIPGELHERELKDNATNRNEALTLAKNKGDYLLLIDANQGWVENEGFSFPALTSDVYYVGIRTSAEIRFQEFLIKNKLNWTWKGPVYEMLSCEGIRTKEDITNACLVIMGMKASMQCEAKYLSDAAILEKTIQENPSDARSVYYLAMTYMLAQKYDKALEFYEKRAGMGEDPEEIFHSLLVIGTLQEKLKMKPEIFISSYNKAFQFRLTRAEPLYCMAKYYLANKSYLLSFLIAEYALTIPYPSDRGAVGFPIYDFELLLQYAESAHQLGRIEETCSAYQKLISCFENFMKKNYYSKKMKDSIKNLLPNMKQFLEENRSKKNPPHKF